MRRGFLAFDGLLTALALVVAPIGLIYNLATGDHGSAIYWGAGFLAALLYAAILLHDWGQE